VHEYVFLQFGIKPPLNIRYYYNGDDKTNLTFIPLDEAIRLTEEAMQ